MGEPLEQQYSDVVHCQSSKSATDVLLPALQAPASTVPDCDTTTVNLKSSTEHGDTRDSSSSSSNNNRRNPPATVPDAKAVFWARLALLGILLGAAIAVCLGIVMYVKDNEKEAFDEHFQESAEKVLEAIGSSLDTTFTALDVLAASLVGHAQETNQVWPLVTVPFFGRTASKVLTLSKLKLLAILPLISPQTRREWEEYSIRQGKSWIDKDLALMETDPNYFGPRYYDYEEDGVLFNDFGDIPYNTTRYMLPNWQNYPVYSSENEPPYNFDYMSVSFPDSMEVTLEKGTATITEAYLLPDPDNAIQVEETALWIEWLRNFVTPQEDPSEPVSDIYYPFYNVTDTVAPPQPPSQHLPVGILTGTFFWRDMIVDIMPQASDGIVVVFKNTCNVDFTYQIDGPKTTFLGRGDLHDSEFDDMRISSNIQNLRDFRLPESGYSGPRLDEEFCPFSFHIYPTQEMKNTFLSNDPILFGVGTALIFFFTSAMFLVYDFCVKRQQKKLEHSAVLSAENVVLLEEMVKERTRSLQISMKQVEEANQRIQKTASAQLEHFASMSHEIRTRTCVCVGVCGWVQTIGVLSTLS
jgi:hypothetical protein